MRPSTTQMFGQECVDMVRDCYGKLERGLMVRFLCDEHSYIIQALKLDRNSCYSTNNTAASGSRTMWNKVLGGPNFCAVHPK